MPKEAKQKIKLLYLMEVLLSKTDENNCLSAQDLIDYLAQKDIIVERKTIFSDIATLKEFGLDVYVSKAKAKSGYYVLARDFELAELKIIVEAILSSKYISSKKSKELIRKLETLVGPSDRKMLEREVFVSGRVKTENESIFYNADILHNAMLKNQEISFIYLDWNINKELVPRRNKKQYRVSPWALTIKDDNYYLIAYDSEKNEIRHYRVDKMKDIKGIQRSLRQGKEEFESFDVGEYSTKNFGMFRGDSEMVSLTLPESKIGIIFDRFGKDIDVRPLKKNLVSVRVPVLVSNQFFGWLAGIGPDFKITMPKDVKIQYIDYLKSILTTYGENE